MRRLFVLPLVILGFASAVAVGSTDTRALAAKSSVAGTITALSSTSITVHSVFDVTCKITHASLKVGDFAVGDAVKIGCEHGVLRRIKHVIGSTPATSSTAGVNADHTATTTGSGTPSTSTASGLGAITAINTGSGTITVTGDRSLTCTLAASSPSLAGYHLGDRVRIGCVNGVLYVITRSDGPVGAPPTTSVPTTTTTPSNLYGYGTISALSSTSISVTGERTLTCSIGAGSPGVGDYHVGDHVKTGCQNGVLVAIVRDATETTTTAVTTTATTQPSAYTSVTGTLTALSTSSISVSGDGTVLTCPIGPGAQSLAGFNIGDTVKLYCVNGTFYRLLKPTPASTGDPVTTTTTTTPTTATPPASYTSVTGTLTALSTSSISVAGDGTVLTCPIGPGAQSLAGFNIGDTVKLYCVNGAFYRLLKPTPPPAPTPTPAPAPPTTTTTPVQYSYGTGTITSLSTDRITVTGDAVLSCTLSATTPSVAAYHIGDSVKMYCQGGALYALLKA